MSLIITVKCESMVIMTGDSSEYYVKAQAFLASAYKVFESKYNKFGFSFCGPGSLKGRDIESIIEGILSDLQNTPLCDIPSIVLNNLRTNYLQYLHSTNDLVIHLSGYDQSRLQIHRINVNKNMIEYDLVYACDGIYSTIPNDFFSKTNVLKMDKELLTIEILHQFATVMANLEASGYSIANGNSPVLPPVDILLISELDPFWLARNNPPSPDK